MRTSKRSYEEVSSSSSSSDEDVTDYNYNPSHTQPTYTMPSLMSKMKKRIKTTPAKTTLLPQKLVQTRLAFEDIKITCKDCGMSYMPTYAMDVKLHTRFHSQSCEGRDWAPEWGTTVSISDAVKERILDGDRIVKVTHSSKAAEKRAAQDLITLVNTELSAPPENPTWKNGPAGGGAAYLYICPKKRKAIAVLVVERISRGRPMLASTSELLKDAPPKNIAEKVKQDRFPVVMGIARIFTAKNYRRMGIGSVLLDIARTDFIYGIKIEKSQVAWSQPSASGAKLAIAWAPQESPGTPVTKQLMSPPPSSPGGSSDEGISKPTPSHAIILTYLESDAIVRAS